MVPGAPTLLPQDQFWQHTRHFWLLDMGMLAGLTALRWFCPMEVPAAPLDARYVMHPPKHETFDLRARTNTDPKGIVRAVDEYAVQPWGLYLARPTPGRAQFHYLESWLLPSLGLRATIFHFNPGHERDQDYYLDVGEYTPRRRVDL